MKTKDDISFRTNLNDLIAAKQGELEKLNDKIANYEDPAWIADRRQKLVDKRELIEHDLIILQAAARQLQVQPN